MKRKVVLFLLCIIAIMLLGTVVFATMNNNENQNKILTGEKVSSVGETYTEVNLQNRMIGVNSNIPSLEKANQYLKDINIDTTTFTTENSTVKRFNNALDSKEEVVISNNEATIKIDNQTGDLITYINNKETFTVNSLDDTTVKEKAIKIFNNLNNVYKDSYELIYLEKFDDEIWRAGFAKKYDDLVNQAENIKFSFCPETEEIVTLVINNADFDNNEIVLTENDARNIAQPYLNKSIANNMNIKIEIVKPNYFYAEVSEDDSVYTNVNRTRRAYVCTFDNEAESKVFIDCTTGEIIGGDMNVGGVY